VSRLEEEVASHAEVIGAKEVKMAETDKKLRDCELQNTKLKALLVKTKKELNAARSTEQEGKAKEREALQEQEAARSEVEALKAASSELAATNQQLEAILKQTQEANSGAVQHLENKISVLKSELEHAREEYAENKKEFENYKVRVHSVLSKDRRQTSAPPEQSKDIERLEKLVEQLKITNSQLGSQLKACEADYSELQAEHERLLSAHRQALQDADQREKALREKLDTALADDRVHLANHQDTLKLLHQQLETTTQAFKRQTQSLEDEHKSTVDSLKEQIGVLEWELASLRSSDNHLHSSPKNSLAEEDLMDIMHMERQDGEGSELTDLVPETPTWKVSPIPLERLLSQDEQMSTTSSIITNKESTTVYEFQIAKAGKKIDHLTELLNESEANNLRMTEQSRVLKEEIRRLERNTEREEHAKNLEYMKNVILKFLTLTGGTEKERLVPVLTTLLRLSPDEENHIAQLTKGEGGDAEGTGSGWTGYLHRWSGMM